MPEFQDEDLLTVPEVSQLFDIPRSTVYAHIDAGLLPAIRRGVRSLRVRRAAANAFYDRPANPSAASLAATA